MSRCGGVLCTADSSGGVPSRNIPKMEVEEATIACGNHRARRDGQGSNKQGLHVGEASKCLTSLDSRYTNPILAQGGRRLSAPGKIEPAMIQQNGNP